MGHRELERAQDRPVAAERDDELAARDEVARGGARPEVDDVEPELARPRLDLEDLRLALAGRVDEDADGAVAAVGPDAERFHQRGASQAARLEGAPGRARRRLSAVTVAAAAGGAISFRRGRGPHRHDPRHRPHRRHPGRGDRGRLRAGRRRGRGCCIATLRARRAPGRGGRGTASAHAAGARDPHGSRLPRTADEQPVRRSNRRRRRRRARRRARQHVPRPVGQRRAGPSQPCRDRPRPECGGRLADRRVQRHQVGSALQPTGDVDGDGIDDFALPSSPGFDEPTDTTVGARTQPARSFDALGAHGFAIR